jgi:phosphate transport system substrate-binding protein
MKDRMWMIGCMVAAALVLPRMSVPAYAQVKVDPKLPEYKPVQGVSGSLKSVGSDTMNNEMTLWAEGFTKLYPNLQPEIEGKGSSTAPPALIAGTAQFGPMSRPMKSQEIDEFKKKFGYEPVALSTSIDMLAVYVHKDNPIKGLTLQQVDAIFSKSRKGGFDKEIRTWGDLGLEDKAWAAKPIALYGRNAASGTYAYFREHALFNGDFRNDVKEQPGTASVVQGVGGDKYAIGYGGIGYKTADVRALPLAKNAKAKFIPAEPNFGYTGQYPMARFLFVYVNYQPGNSLDPLRREFIRYIFSQQGQSDVIRSGNLPIGQKIAKDSLASVGIK